MIELITLDCYKESKMLKSTERDGKLQALITQVSALIENYCNRLFTAYFSTAKVEYHDAKVNKVFLIEFPIIEVSTVKTSIDGGVTKVTLVENSVAKDGYFVDLEEGSISTQLTKNNFLDIYDVSHKSLEVTYTSGYSEDTLPEDLKLSVIDLVHYYEQGEARPSQTLLGGSIDNPQPYAANSFPPHIRRVLDLYRYSP